MPSDDLAGGASRETDEARWIGDTLNAATRGYAVDLAALREQLSARGVPLDGPRGGPGSVRHLAVVPEPAGRPDAGQARRVPRGDGRPGLVPVRGRGRTVLAVAAGLAVVVAGSVAVEVSRQLRDGGGTVEVNPAGPVPGPSRTDGPASPSPGRPAPSVPPLPPATSVSSAPSPSSAPVPSGGDRLPAALSWTDSGVVVAPGPDPAGTTGLKDPTVVVHDGRWHVFATAVRPGGLSLVHLAFTDWGAAASAPQDRLELTPVGGGYRAAPQVFWFAPQKLWYLVYQTGTNASYSTNPDIDDPGGWSAPRSFYAGTPRTVAENLGDGNWVDMWVVCDSTTCHLFSTDTKGRLFRSQTRLRDFPRGMSEPVVALEEPTGNALLDGAAVYRVAGRGGYLLLAEAIDPSGHRYVRSWRATTPAGPWTPRPAPFAAAAAVTPTGPPWTVDLAQGELLRAGTDQTMTIDPCGLRYLVSGHGPAGPGGAVPWRIGLLEQRVSPC